MRALFLLLLLVGNTFGINALARDPLCYSITGIDAKTGIFGTTVVFCPHMGRPKPAPSPTPRVPDLSWYPGLKQTGAYSQYKPHINGSSVASIRPNPPPQISSMGFAAQTLASIVPAMVVNQQWGDTFEKVLHTFKGAVSRANARRQQEYQDMHTAWDAEKQIYEKAFRDSSAQVKQASDALIENTQKRMAAIPYPARVNTFAQNGIAEAIVNLRYQESAKNSKTAIEKEQERVENLPPSLAKQKSRNILDLANEFKTDAALAGEYDLRQTLIDEATNTRRHALFKQPLPSTPIADRVQQYKTKKQTVLATLPSAKEQNPSLGFTAEVLHQTAEAELNRGNLSNAESFQKLTLTTIDVALGFVPIVSFIKDLTELTTGKNYITGETLSWGERAIAAVGVATAGSIHYITTPIALMMSGLKTVSKNSATLIDFERSVKIAKQGLKALDPTWAKEMLHSGEITEASIAFAGKLTGSKTGELLSQKDFQNAALKHTQLSEVVKQLPTTTFHGIEARAIPKIVPGPNGTQIFTRTEDVFAEHAGMTVAEGRYSIGGVFGDKAMYSSVSENAASTNQIIKNSLLETELRRDAAHVDTRAVLPIDVIDLRSIESSNPFGKNLNIDSMVKDYKDLTRGYEETQILADTIRTLGISGILVPSSKSGLNLVRFLK